MNTGPRAGGDAGTSLLLFPAAFLVVIVLGTIAVDLSALHLARRTALRAASQAADDAAAMVDDDELHRSGRVRLDRVAAERTATAEVTALLGTSMRGRPVVEVDSDARIVRVRVAVEATAVFGVLTAAVDRRIEVTAVGRLIEPD